MEKGSWKLEQSFFSTQSTLTSRAEKRCRTTIPLQLHLCGRAGKLSDLDTPSSACIPSIGTETIKCYSWHIISQGSEEVKKKNLIFTHYWRAIHDEAFQRTTPSGDRGMRMRAVPPPGKHRATSHFPNVSTALHAFQGHPHRFSYWLLTTNQVWKVSISIPIYKWGSKLRGAHHHLVEVGPRFLNRNPSCDTMLSVTVVKPQLFPSRFKSDTKEQC